MLLNCGFSSSSRYALQFHRETEAEIRERKEAARKGIVPVTDEGLEIDTDAYFIPELDFPVRPPWNYNMSPAELEGREHRYFTVSYLILNLKILPPKIINISMINLHLFIFRSMFLHWRKSLIGKR